MPRQWNHDENREARRLYGYDHDIQQYHRKNSDLNESPMNGNGNTSLRSHVDGYVPQASCSTNRIEHS